jgi:RNA polymerase sigma-70 factor (ECF subfamily)
MNCQTPSETEPELIADILAGNIQLYHQLIHPYMKCVYTMSFSYMKNEMDAEDVTQETFIKAFRNLHAFRGDSKFSTWLISIALNEARYRLRRQVKVRMVSIDEPRGEETTVSPTLLRDWRELPSSVVERKEVGKLIQGAIDRLPVIYRQVFLLREIEEINSRETAQILGISPSLVKTRSFRARMMLRRMLAPKLKAIKGRAELTRVQ